MASKQKTSSLACADKMPPPATLEDHPFYGLMLDSEQAEFRDAIWSDENIIVFCNAAAGTGKTLVATATADLLVRYGKFDSIVYLVSPYAESKQGYLPGTLAEKSQYYYQPLRQALMAIGVDSISAISDESMQSQKMGVGYISCQTDSFIRGVNYKRSVVIIDEAQNYTISQLRTALTRCSDDCKVIVIGSMRQIDLDDPFDSGFQYCIEHFSGQPWSKLVSLTMNHRGKLSSHADEMVG